MQLVNQGRAQILPDSGYAAAEADVDYALSRAIHSIDANRCALPMGLVNQVQSFIQCFPDHFPHEKCPGHTDIPFPKVKDWDAEAGRFILDDRIMRKLPDWSYAEESWRPADMVNQPV